MDLEKLNFKIFLGQGSENKFLKILNIFVSFITIENVHIDIYDFHFIYLKINLSNSFPKLSKGSKS